MSSEHSRVGTELARRGIDYSFGASTFWLWGILGSIIVVGPFIYTYKVLLVGIVHTGITYALYFGSMQRLKAQTVAVMSYIVVVGPFIYTYKLLKSMNLLAADYNAKG